MPPLNNNRRGYDCTHLSCIIILFPSRNLTLSLVSNTDTLKRRPWLVVLIQKRVYQHTNIITMWRSLSTLQSQIPRPRYKCWARLAAWLWWCRTRLYPIPGCAQTAECTLVFLILHRPSSCRSSSARPGLELSSSFTERADKKPLYMYIP